MTQREDKEFRKELGLWVNDFQENREQRKIRDEEDVKSGIIEPVLEILGWDPNNPSEVKKEESVGRKKADYALKIDEKTEVIIEAKALDKKLSEGDSDSLTEYEKQAINYAYNKGINWAILTNGEEWRLYNAYWKGEKLAFTLEIGDFPKKENLKKVSIFRKENVKEGEIDDYFEDHPKRPDVDEEVTQVLLNARAEITESIVSKNNRYGEEDLRDGIQTVLDRLLFMKICEDRDIIEHGQLRQTKQMVEGDPQEETTLTDYLHVAFKRFRKVYDGGLFDEQIADELEIENYALRNTIDTLYKYDFASVDVDILGRIYENYLANVLTKLDEGGLEWITDNSERKEHGQFYTPQYVVDYIVDGVEIDSDSTVLDPACGSGAFLIKAYDELKKEYISEQENDSIEVEEGYAPLSNYVGKKTETQINRQILTDNLFGVDLNEEAVEITRINLWLRSIQKDTKLNELDHNIKSGNSLISDEDEVENYFEDPEDKDIFNWKKEFSNILESGGFDAIIGNPPYVSPENTPDDDREYYEDSEEFKKTYGRFDLYTLFLERSLKLLKDGGRMGFIIPYSFLTQRYAKELRKWIVEEFAVKEIVDLTGKDVFEDADVETIVLVIENSEPENNKITITKDSSDRSEIVIDDRYEISQSLFQDTYQSQFRIDLGGNAKEIVDRIEDKGIRLEDICVAITGMDPHDSETGRSKNDLVHSEKIGENCRRYVESKEFGRYENADSDKFIEYLPDKMHRPKFPELFENEKILIPDITGPRGILGAKDEKGHYTDRTVINCLLGHKLEEVKEKQGLNLNDEKIEESRNYSTNGVLAQLNSSLVNFYFLKMLGGDLHVYSSKMRQLPIIPSEDLEEFDAELLRNNASKILKKRRRGRACYTRGRRAPRPQAALRSQSAHTDRASGRFARTHRRRGRRVSRSVRGPTGRPLRSRRP